jgi:cytidine deaminase
MLLPEDLALIDAARAVIRARYRPGWHAVGCALRTRAGRVHLGVHLECNVGRIAVCAEAIAIGRAATEGEGGEIATIVAVRQAAPDDVLPGVVAPCGMCREMISDYAPDARVIVPADGAPQVVSIASLLPNKYRRSGAP